MIGPAKLPIASAAEELVRLALKRGAPDNVTVIVAKVIRADAPSEETETDAVLFDDTIREERRRAAAASPTPATPKAGAEVSGTPRSRPPTR